MGFHFAPSDVDYLPIKEYYCNQVPPRGFLLTKQIIMSLITYLKDTQGELKHVSWPSRNQAIVFSIVVVLISVFVSFFLGFFDYVFKLVLQKFVI